MKIMLPLLSCLACIAVARPAGAALPPQYQNAKDLDVMVGYLKMHPLVMQSVRSIDIQGLVIRYGNDCQAVFGRAYTPKPPGWAGPADPLEFKRSTCPVQ